MITASIESLAEKLDTLLERTNAGSPRFLPIDAAAAYSGLSECSIRRLISGGKLQGLRPVKGRIVLDRLALDSYVLSCDTRPRTGRGRA
jgi:hypothetical protein